MRRGPRTCGLVYLLRQYGNGSQLDDPAAFFRRLEEGKASCGTARHRNARRPSPRMWVIRIAWLYMLRRCPHVPRCACGFGNFEYRTTDRLGDIWSLSSFGML